MSMTEAEHNFWTESDDYHELVKTFEQNIDIYHPDTITSDRMCPCLDYASYCGWAATTVNYYNYNGPNVTNI